MGDDEFARDILTRAAGGESGTARVLGFSVDDVVHGGRSRLRRRRWKATAGGVAVVAAVGVGAGVTGFTGGWGTSEGGVGPGATPAQRAAADGKTAYQAMVKVFKRLDPSGKHLTLAEPISAEGFRHPSSCQANSGAFSYIADGDWTADGRPATDTSPHLTVMVEFGDAKYTVRGPYDKTPLPDHSLMATETYDSRGISASRTLPDGRSLQISVMDAAADPNSPKPDPVKPFPFTEQQLAAVVSDLSLKFPFADGYEPSGGCDALLR